ALVPVTIAARPAISPVVLTSNSTPVGGTIYGTSYVTGGALPLEYWWNLSAPASTVGAGTLHRDGVIGLSTVATVVGPDSLTLTVVDALGTRVSSRVVLMVTGDYAASIVVVGPPNETATAGLAVPITFEAFDLLGARVPGYASNVTVRVQGAAAGTVWINASASGAVSRDPNGSFHPAASLWRQGYLNLTIAVARSGPVDVALLPAGSIGGPPPIALAVGPDLGNLRLLNASFVHPGARTNATLYEISDRFGNAVPGGSVVVRSVFGATVTEVDSPIHLAGGRSTVWVNFSASGGGAGAIYVLYEVGGRDVTLLPPIEVPAPAASPSLASSLIPGLVLVLAIAAGSVALAAYVRRQRRRRDGPEAPGPDGGAALEEELKRLAEGRAHVLSHTPSDRPVDLDEMAFGWTGRPPDTAELAEWVGSLVSEGLLRASVGPDGRPRFVRTEPPPTPPRPRVEIDPTVLDAALARRSSEGWPEPPADDGDAEPGPDEPDPPAD
ncbi:MAG TPA: hypothetical protein VLY85_02765, partial [Thermoplasmata archaeon]|nr:hypothetical protein [Thermoplasmata archaeon]